MYVEHNNCNTYTVKNKQKLLDMFGDRPRSPAASPFGRTSEFIGSDSLRSGCTMEINIATTFFDGRYEASTRGTKSRTHWQRKIRNSKAMYAMPCYWESTACANAHIFTTSNTGKPTRYMYTKLAQHLISVR